MTRPSDAESRWLRSVREGDVKFFFPSRGEAYYLDGTSKAKDRGVLTRMRKKGWLTHDYNPDNRSHHIVTLTETGREAFMKIGGSRA
jgi:hypothetical protein